MNIRTSALTSASLLAAALWIGSAAAAPLPSMYPGNPDARSETLMPGQAALDMAAPPADLAADLQRQFDQHLGGLNRHGTVERDMVGQCDTKRRGNQPGHTQRESVHNHNLLSDGPK